MLPPLQSCHEPEKWDVPVGTKTVSDVSDEQRLDTKSTNLEGAHISPSGRTPQFDAEVCASACKNTSIWCETSRLDAAHMPP